MNVALNTQHSHNKINAPKTIDFRVKYKTQKCRYWEQQGYCPFGQMCAFAHFTVEMRNKGQIHEHYKTKPCLNFNKFAYCKYGDRCLFLHKLGDATRDHDRTRSNSPVQSVDSPKITGRHMQNLKILNEFGLAVFEAHMRRTQSRVIHSSMDDQCNRHSVSTEPQMACNQHLEDFNYNDQIQRINQDEGLEREYNLPPRFWNEYLRSEEQKKVRMYSM